MTSIMMTAVYTAAWLLQTEGIPLTEGGLVSRIRRAAAEPYFVDDIHTMLHVERSNYKHRKIHHLYETKDICKDQNVCFEPQIPREQKLHFQVRFGMEGQIGNHQIKQLLEEFRLGLRRIACSYDRLGHMDDLKPRKSLLKKFVTGTKNLAHEVTAALQRSTYSSEEKETDFTQHCNPLPESHTGNKTRLDVMGWEIVKSSEAYLVDWDWILQELKKRHLKPH